MKELHSKIDESVNFINGPIEARYVRRVKNYFTCYLSSQAGCKMACKMCHLTRDGKTQATNLSRAEIIGQAKTVLNYYLNYAPESRQVNFAFMVRGEPLLNPSVDDALCLELMQLAVTANLVPKVCISTIFARDTNLVTRFPISKPDMYYSVYSLDQVFRDKWLPKALTPTVAFSRLNEYQRTFRKINVLHFPFIKDENDSLVSVEAICQAIEKERYDINIVKYNPPDASSEESDLETIKYLVAHMKFRLPTSRVTIKDRVGEDVFASCGMFA